MGSKRVLVFNDLHIPYHDKKAVQLAIYTAKSIGVHEIVINGDLLDFYSINMHQKNKHPEVNQSLESEIIEGREFLELLRHTFGDTVKIHFIFGNHEYRMERYILQECKALVNMVKLETQLNLSTLGISHQLYNSSYNLVSNLYIQHSPPSYGVNGARTSLLKKHDASFIWACSHRVQQAHITGSSGIIYSAYFNGWLGSTSLSDEHKRVFEYTKDHHEWQQCFSIVDVVNDQYFVHQCLIKDYKTSLDGSLFQV